MRILIIAGIFEPESGGPATYAPQLAAQLVERGEQVTVVTYSNDAAHANDATYPFTLVRVVRGNKFLNRIRYFLALLPHMHECDAAYLLDWFAAGIPAALAARWYHKPYAVRIGGDYLWEQRYLEGGNIPCSLAQFYERGMHRAPGFRALYWIIRRVLGGAAMIICNAGGMRDLYVKYYDIVPARTRIIENPLPDLELVSIRRDMPTKEIVFWGRLIAMKNVASLVRAFAQAKLPADFTLTVIGDGPQKASLEQLALDIGVANRVAFENAMPRAQVFARVRNARAFVLPSWTDIAPNQVYEALALGLPSIVTKENYLAIHDQLPEMIDPASIDDITEKLEMLANEDAYERFASAFRAIRFSRTRKDVAQEHDDVFRHMV